MSKSYKKSPAGRISAKKPGVIKWWQKQRHHADRSIVRNRLRTANYDIVDEYFVHKNPSNFRGCGPGDGKKWFGIRAKMCGIGWITGHWYGKS